MGLLIKEQQKCLILEVGSPGDFGERWYFKDRKELHAVIDKILDIKKKHGHKLDYAEELKDPTRKKK